MATRIRKVITAINPSGKAFSEIHTEQQRLDGSWEAQDPIPLEAGGPEADEWQQLYNSVQATENGELKAAIAAITASHEAALKSRDDQIAALTSDLATMTAERNKWRDKSPPEREVDTKELIVRIADASPDAIKKIWSSDTKAAAIATKTLFAADGKVDLNSEVLLEILNDLVAVEILTTVEVAKILE